MADLKELQEKRAGIAAEMRTILDAADAETRALTSEEQQNYDRLESDLDSFGETLKRAMKQNSLEEELRANAEGALDPRQAQGDRDALPGDPEEGAEATKYARAFDHYMRRGIHDLEAEERQLLMRGIDRTVEQRDQLKSSNTSGGFLVPTDFNKQLVEHLVQSGTMRQTRSTVIVTATGEAIQIPKTTSHGAATWTAEGAQASSNDESFGQVTLNAFKALRLVKVSIELLEDNAVDLEGFLARELGRAIGALENTAYVAGTGSSQPQGLIGVASLGTAGATGQTTSITADNLIDLFYAVGPQYRRSAEWQMADSTLKAVRKLKDSTGNYLWAPGIGGYGAGATLANPAPDTLLGRPVWDDPDVPVMAANAKSVLFGDYSAYWIRDVGVQGPVAGEKGVGTFFVRRLDERFADNGEVGFLAWHRTDGNLIDQTGAIKYYQNSAT